MGNSGFGDGRDSDKGGTGEARQDLARLVGLGETGFAPPRPESIPTASNLVRDTRGRFPKAFAGGARCGARAEVRILRARQESEKRFRASFHTRKGLG